MYILVSDETFCTQSQIMLEKFPNLRQNLFAFVKVWQLCFQSPQIFTPQKIHRPTSTCTVLRPAIHEGLPFCRLSFGYLRGRKLKGFLNTPYCVETFSAIINNKRLITLSIRYSSSGFSSESGPTYGNGVNC